MTACAGLEAKEGRAHAHWPPESQTLKSYYRSPKLIIIIIIAVIIAFVKLNIYYPK